MAPNLTITRQSVCYKGYKGFATVGWVAKEERREGETSGLPIGRWLANSLFLFM